MNGQAALPLDEERTGEVVSRRMVLPYLPPSKNVYDSWPGQWKSSAKRKWERDIATMCSELGIHRGLPQVGLAAKLVFASKARRDPQNYAQALWNWVPDALQVAGVLVDDREGCVEIGPNWGLQFAYDLRTTIPPKKRQRTILTVAYRLPVGAR